MKFTWGHGITIAIIAIMVTFTTAFVASLSHNNDLVTEGYYEKELRFQDEIDKKQNAADSGRVLSFEQIEEGLHITINNTSTLETGQIVLYRADDKDADVVLDINQPQAGAYSSLIPYNQLKKGRYIIKADWTESTSKQYAAQKTVYIP